MINLSLELWQKFALSALIFRVRLTCPQFYTSGYVTPAS